MKNFKDYAVTNPGQYNVELTIPELSTVSQLIAWLNSNPTAVLTSNPGAILQVGTKNNAENLNEAQKDALMLANITSAVDGLTERYTHNVLDLDNMFKNTSCGAFNARMLVTPVLTNTLDAPVLSVGDEDYTICVNGTPIAAGDLLAGKSYLIALDVDTKKANIMQLEITNSVAMESLDSRVSALEEVTTMRTYLGSQASLGWDTPNIFQVPKKHQFIYFDLFDSSASVDTAVGTYIDVSNPNDHIRKYAAEIHQVDGVWYMRSIGGEDTGDPVNIKFEENGDMFDVYIREAIGNVNIVMAFTDIIL